MFKESAMSALVIALYPRQSRAEYELLSMTDILPIIKYNSSVKHSSILHINLDIKHDLYVSNCI